MCAQYLRFLCVKLIYPLITVFTVDTVDMEVEGVKKKAVNLYIRTDIREKALKAIDEGLFPGINSLSSLVELALEKILRGGLKDE